MRILHDFSDGEIRLDDTFSGCGRTGRNLALLGYRGDGGNLAAQRCSSALRVDIKPRAPDASEIAQAIAVSPADPWMQALAGRIAYEKQDYPGAVQHLLEAIRLRPDYLQARYTLAQTYRAMGQEGDTAHEVEQVQRLRKQNSTAADEPVDIEPTLPAQPK